MMLPKESNLDTSVLATGLNIPKSFLSVTFKKIIKRFSLQSEIGRVG